MLSGLDRFAHHLGRGLVASVAGTAAMTVSSTLEMRVRGRPPSDAPGRAAARMLRVRVADDPATGRLASVGHHVVFALATGAAYAALEHAG